MSGRGQEMCNYETEKLLTERALSICAVDALKSKYRDFMGKRFPNLPKEFSV